jgi:uncharacterized protein (DUF1501 family)
MKRRDFIKNLGMVTGAGIASFSIAGIPVKAFANPFMNINSANGKILVIVQFKGGNDGLNTVIPVDQYSSYISYRPNIRISQSNIISLTTATGLHPSLKPLQNLYNNGNLAIVQNVGYPNQNLSHFRSTDIWLSASDANQPSYDGWIGRYLPKVYPTYPNTPPTSPMAVQLGSVESLLFENQTYGGLGIAFQNPNLFYQMVQGISVDNDPAPATLAGDELKFLKEISAQSVQYATTIRNAANAGNSKTDYTAGNAFGQQMQIVANLIFGGLETPVYLVTLDGFDTHVNEEDTAKHPKLLSDFANSVSAFLSDIQSRGYGDKVVLMTFSEFGRRVKENASKGTDHGSASPLFVVGNNVQGGINGPNADLKNLDANGNLVFKIDFRSVYSSILIQHFGMTNSQSKDILGNDFSTFPLLKNSAAGVDLSTEVPDEFVLKQNYPNPFNPVTTIQYSVPSPQYVKLSVYDIVGRKIVTLTDSYQPSGNYSVNFDGSRLASGTYFYALESEKGKIVKKMSLIK